ncbi:thymidylate kinase [Pseudomonas phage Lu11]|uniref:thymidylate kinase n=1 Tax=Pseudomonas phage Lu11 TaxID=1161927 RepID=UPI00025F17EF|nr:thymidylate kinase [Pseudomonas phage Lu11]AFH14732.1 thymidylate kinase [Pseudomonas phage Lu11]
MKGLFIALESLEAAGKGTATDYVGGWARRRGLDMVFTREPGGTEFAEPIRAHMLSWEGKVPPACQALLSYAARVEHTQSHIIPSLNRGAHVFTERYYASALAYQTQTYAETQKVHDLVSQYLVKPDLTILLDISPELSLERMQKSRVERGIELDEFEKKPIEYFRGVRDAYYAQIDDSWAIVDASQPLPEVERQILAILDKKLGLTNEAVSNHCVG